MLHFYIKKMEKIAARIKLEKDNIICLPYFINSGVVNNNIKSKGIFFGLNLIHGKDHLSRSVFESIGFMLKEIIIELELAKNNKINSILSVGGASKSIFLSQVKSNISNKKIIVIKNNEVGCLGVAILASVANNIYKDLNEAVINMVKIDKIYYPEEKTIAIYEERYIRFKEIFNRIKELFLNYY